MKFKSTLSIILSAVFFLVANQAFSADNGSIDVVLVMDSSGSMKKTDPQSLRIPAAKLFISLLKDGDRAGIIGFSGEGDTLINLTSVKSRDNKEKLLTATELITSKGSYTNLHEALIKGMEALSKDFTAGRTQIIILMSDGMMDVGDPVEDSRLVEKIRSELSVTLEESGIKVYTIAFTENSDRALLERISKRTGGFYNLTLSDQDFHVVFTSIFESLKSPEMLPMTKNGFKVDDSVEEVTIVATKGSLDTKIMLTAPGGQNYTSDSKDAGIEWFLSNKFDMITVRNPTAGKWEILFSTGENNKAYIITDLQLKTNFEKLYSTYGEPRDVQVWLEKEGQILNEMDVLDQIEFLMELTAPDGRTTNMKPFGKGDGTYVRSIAPFSPGNYTLKVIAKGKTFERAKDFVFNVADVRESKEDVKHDRTKKLDELLKEEKAAKAALEAQLKASQGEEVERISWWKVIGYFTGINFIIGLGILAFFKIKKLKNNKPPKRIKIAEVKEHKVEEPTVKAETPESKEKEKEEVVPEPKIEATAQTQEESAAVAEKETPQPQPVESESNAQESAVQQEAGPSKTSDQEIALDDIDSDTPESIEEPSTQEEKADAEADNQEIALEDEKDEAVEKKEADVVSEQDVAASNQGTSESHISQDDLDALLAEAKEREPETEVVQEGSETKEEADNQDILSDAPQKADDVQQDADEEVVPVDAGEADHKTETEVAVQKEESGKEPEQKAAAMVEEKPPEAKAEDAEEQVAKKVEDEDNIDDMWAEAFQETEGGKQPEQKAEARSDEPPETKAEIAEEAISGEVKDEDNIDDMWAEAFQEAEGEKVPGQKAEAKSEEKAVEAKTENPAEDVPEEVKDEENVDDMWAEAFKEAEGQEVEDKKPEVSAKSTIKPPQDHSGEDPVNG